MDKDFDPYSMSEADQQCPHRLYATARDVPGLQASEAWGGFYTAVNYDDVNQVLLDSKTFHAADGISLFGVPLGFILPESDGPQHRRYRRVINSWFTREAIQAHEPQVRAVARELLDQLAGQDEVDLMRDFCRSLVGTVNFTIVLKVGGQKELEHCRALADLINYEPERALEAMAGLRTFAEQDIARRRNEPPRGDALDELVHDRNEDALSDDEASSMFTALVFGALDTTANTLGIVLGYLAANHDARDLLVADPSAIPTAIDEIIRWDGVSQGVVRTVHQDVVVGGQQLHPGDRVWACQAAANRDPSHFEDPDQVDLSRKPNRHIAFGAGSHRCVGMHLANLLLRVGVHEVLSRFPDLDLAPGQAVTYRTMVMRSPAALPVQLQPSTHGSHSSTTRT